MKKIILALIIVIAGLGGSACTTAHHAVTGATDVATHAVTKTGHAIEHGGEELHEHL